MNMMMRVDFVLSINIVFLTFSTEEECPNVSGGCCEGFFRDYTKDICTECPAGYYSVNCTESCETGFYGLRCLEQCNCDSEQRCHHVFGCVDKESITTSVDTFSIEATTEVNSGVETSSTEMTTEVLTTVSTTHISFKNSTISDYSPDRISLVNGLLLFTIPTIIIGIIIVLVVTIVRKLFVCTITRKTQDEIIIDPYIESQVGAFYEEIDENALNARMSQENEIKHSDPQSINDERISLNILKKEGKQFENNCPIPCQSNRNKYVDPVKEGINQNKRIKNIDDLKTGNDHLISCGGYLDPESDYLTPSNDYLDLENDYLDESNDCKSENSDINDDYLDCTDDYLDPVADCDILPILHQTDNQEYLNPNKSDNKNDSDLDHRGSKVLPSNEYQNLNQQNDGGHLKQYQSLDVDWQRQSHIYTKTVDKNSVLKKSSSL